MVVVIAVLTALAVVVIALVAVGRETFTLASQPKQAIFDVDEAVDFVADHLPDEVTARITYDDVRALVRFHLEHIAALGAPAERWNAARSPLVVVDDEEGAEVLMTRAVEEGLDLTPDDVAAVLAAELAYFRAIGAIGPPVPEPLELLAAEQAAAAALPPGDRPPADRAVPEPEPAPNEADRQA